MYIKLWNYSRAMWKWCQESFDGCFCLKGTNNASTRLNEVLLTENFILASGLVVAVDFCQIAGNLTFLTSRSTIHSKMRSNFRSRECSTNSNLKIASKQNTCRS